MRAQELVLLGLANSVDRDLRGPSLSGQCEAHGAFAFWLRETHIHRFNAYCEFDFILASQYVTLLALIFDPFVLFIMHV